MRILALDVGEKNIGLAISDKLGWTAQGLPSLRREVEDKSISAIVRIVKENDVSEIVVGMPVSLDGSLGKSAQKVAKFIEELKREVNLSIKAWDERLTSLQANKLMIEAGLSRKKRKRKVDQIAAQLILQNYLDSKAKTQDVSKDNPE